MIRVLLVDSDAISRSMLAVLFAGAGYHVDQASNGVEALRIHRRHPVDVMIVELILPEKDGFEMLMEMRAKPCMPKFIALTGGGDFPIGHYLRTAKQLGAHLVFAKPLESEQLLATVNQLMRKGNSHFPPGAGV